MFSSKLVQDLAFTSRQLSHLLATNDPVSALKKLGEAAGPAYARDIERLRALLTPTQPAPPAFGSTPYAMLAKLIAEVGPAKRSRLFQDFVDYVRQSRGLFETWWTGFVGLISYLVALCAMAVFISGLYALFVLPSFEQMFAQMGGALPDLTELVLSGAGRALLILLVVAVLGLVVWFTVLFRRRIREFAPLPRWPGPALGTLAETYNYGLFVNFARLLLRSGVPPERAIDLAAKHSNQPSGVAYAALLASGRTYGDNRPLAELAVAARLGNVTSEIDFQCDEHLLRLADALVKLRERFGLAVKLFLFCLIASLIVAMYLPIFQMGSVV